MKLKHISAVAVIAILLPFTASAISIDDLQQQIARLLAQVTTLQEQLKNLQTNPTDPQPVFRDRGQIPRACPQILRQLSQGTSGEDVRGLQAYLGVSQTGYFGPLTAGAVAKFQATEGISQVGMVGPQTRAAFARRCGVGSSQNFSASPTSGAAPLAVTFASIGIADALVIDFGDNTSGMLDSVDAGCYTECSLRAMHTYQSAGTYHVAVRGYGDGRLVATKTIRVTGGGTQQPTFTATSRVSWESWQFLVRGEIGSCDIPAPYTVDFGDGISARVDPNMLSYASAENTTAGTVKCGGYFTSHRYAQPGTYTVKLNDTAGTVLKTLTLTVKQYDPSKLNFTTTPQSGSVPLTVQFGANSPEPFSGLTQEKYSIALYDGQNHTYVPLNVVAFVGGGPSSLLRASHTLTRTGEYWATLIDKTRCVSTDTERGCEGSGNAGADSILIKVGR